MSEFAWNAEVAEEAKPEAHTEPNSQPAPEHTSQGSASEQETLTLSANDFSALEERIVRAVEVVRRERHARSAAEERANKADERVSHAEAQLHDQSQQQELLEKEISALRAEREQVRERVERLLGQLDALEL